MPIKKLETTVTAHSTSEDVRALAIDDETKSKLYTLVEAFLLLNSEPSDEQVHQLAAALGMPKEQLEAVIYEFFADTLDDTSVESGFVLRAGDAVGDAASHDGAPDIEQAEGEDADKEASDSDGGPDIEQIKENLGNQP